MTGETELILLWPFFHQLTIWSTCMLWWSKRNNSRNLHQVQDAVYHKPMTLTRFELNLNSTIASYRVNLGFGLKREKVFWSPIPQSRHMSRWDEPIEWSQPILTDFPSWLAGRYHWRIAEHRKRLRTTKSLERYQQEVRRRTRVVRIFPNRASCLWQTSALAMEQSEDWLTGHRYLNMHLLEDEPILFTSVDLLAQEAVTTWSLSYKGNMSHCEGAESTHKTWHNWRGRLDIRYHTSWT